MKQSMSRAGQPCDNSSMKSYYRNIQSRIYQQTLFFSRWRIK